MSGKYRQSRESYICSIGEKVPQSPVCQDGDGIYRTDVASGFSAFYNRRSRRQECNHHCAESVLLAAAAVNMLFLPKAYAYKGFAIREHDITYRSGIIFPKTVTIPFCKVQQVSVRQTPVTRMFGLYAVDIVNGAQFLAETTIPGLTKEKADRIKALLIERIDNESK